MTTKITLTYSLEESQLEVIAKGLGYQETTTAVDEATGNWSSVPNSESKTDYIVRNFTAMIEARVKPLFMTELEAEAQKQRNLAEQQVEQVIQGSREVLVKTI